MRHLFLIGIEYIYYIYYGKILYVASPKYVYWVQSWKRLFINTFVECSVLNNYTKKECVMKNIIKILGIIALVAVIGFSMVACNDGNGGGGGSRGSLDGTWEGTIGGVSSVLVFTDTGPGHAVGEWFLTPGGFRSPGSPDQGYIDMGKTDLCFHGGTVSVSSNTLTLIIKGGETVTFTKQS